MIIIIVLYGNFHLVFVVCRSYNNMPAVPVITGMVQVKSHMCAQSLHIQISEHEPNAATRN